MQQICNHPLSSLDPGVRLFTLFFKPSIILLKFPQISGLIQRWLNQHFVSCSDIKGRETGQKMYYKCKLIKMVSFCPSTGSLLYENSYCHLMRPFRFTFARIRNYARSKSDAGSCIFSSQAFGSIQDSQSNVYSKVQWSSSYFHKCLLKVATF